MSRFLVGVAKLFLVLTTVAFLASIGGAMALAWPVLVPLHFLAAWRSGPVGTAGWSFLAGLSIAEVAWMAAYVVAGEGLLMAVAPIVTFIAAAAGFIALRASRVPPDRRFSPANHSR